MFQSFALFLVRLNSISMPVFFTFASGYPYQEQKPYYRILDTSHVNVGSSRYVLTVVCVPLEVINKGTETAISPCPTNTTCLG